MFIRKTKKPNGDKNYFNYQLVESYRTDRGPRQRILLSLGSKLPLDKEGCKLLAHRIEEIQSGQVSLFAPSEEIERFAQAFAARLREKSFKEPSEHSSTSQIQSVDLSSLEHQDVRSVGVETIAYHAIKELGLESKFKELGLTSRQAEIGVGLLIHRLASPGSERFAHQWLATISGLEEVMQSRFKQLSKNSLYKTGDALLSHKKALEVFLDQQQEQLFDTQDTIFLYDLTNTYFEGKAAHTKARRGVSKEKRSDAPLVTLGLVINQDGFAKRSRIFEGNISEPKTLELILEDLQTDQRDPILCLDGGIATRENLQWLRQRKIRYLTVERHRRPIDLEGEPISFQDKSGQTIRTKLIPTEEGIELHCQSEARQKKEQAIQTFLKQQFEEALCHAHKAIAKKGGMKRYDKVLQRVGRLKEKFRGISAYYEITVAQDPQNPMLAQSICWEFKQDKARKKFDGGYILKGWGVDLTPKQLWKSYITLTEVEAAFRSLKTELGLRPIYHQKDDRIDAHLFITILAYHVLHSIRFRLHQRGMSISWESVRRILSTQVRVTTALKNSNGQVVRIRSTATPTADQRDIYQALGITICAHKLIYSE